MVAQIKFLVLDLDQKHNNKINHIFSTSANISVQYFENTDLMLQTLNGYPEIEIKKKELEVALAEARALKDKITASIEVAKKPFEGRKLDSKVETQIKKAEELRKKAEEVASAQEQELTLLNEKSLKPEERKCHLVIADRSFLGNNPAKWLEELKSKIQLTENKDIPVVTMGYNESIDYIKATVVAGIRDYFVKPVDTLLLKHNSVKISGQNLDSADKMFELQTDSEIKLLLLSKIKKISEFEIELQSTCEFKQNQKVEFIADNFSKEKSGRMLATCLSCVPDQVAKGNFLTSFSFIGLSPHLMMEMRKWIREQYVEQKQKGAE